MLRVVGAAFLGLRGLLVSGNYWGIVQARRTRTNFSCIPILGGLFGCVGTLFLRKSRWRAFYPAIRGPRPYADGSRFDCVCSFRQA